MSFNFKFISGFISVNNIWFRFRNKRGIAFTNEIIFSHRYNYIKHLKLPFGWICEKI